MAKFEFIADDVKKVMNDLKLYRSGWANDIREGWNCSMSGSKEIEYALYEISAVIISGDGRLCTGSYGIRIIRHLV